MVGYFPALEFGFLLIVIQIWASNIELLLLQRVRVESSADGSCAPSLAPPLPPIGRWAGPPSPPPARGASSRIHLAAPLPYTLLRSGLQEYNPGICTVYVVTTARICRAAYIYIDKPAANSSALAPLTAQLIAAS
ncbi:hypothetical protein J6590_030791 [Homalodisca vitripennis]|nr:hypothetical protein J6590_030791 [Homalodisca vitripennis]